MAENFTRIQEDISSKINKALINYKKSPRDRITLSYIETRLEALEQHWSLFLGNHRKIVFEIKPEELEKSSYVLNEVFEKTEELYIEYKAVLRDALSQLKKNCKEKTDKGIEQTSVKLPKIAIPKFSGTYIEWVSFRDLFTSLIHNNRNIDDVQKLHYLKSSITGEAEQLLRHIAVTSNNYVLCWEQLKNRYDNKKYLANNLLKRLTTQKVLSSESCASIKNLLDTTQECLQGLKNLGIDIKSWDILIIFIMSNKLDPESRKLWEQQTSECTQELPTYQQFREFLESRFRSLEFLGPKVPRTEGKTSYTHVASTNSVSCIFCTDHHKLFNCKAFAQQSVEARRNFIQAHHLCFNCFSANHSVYDCKLSTRCRLCKKKHHSLLHLGLRVKGINSTPDQVAVVEPGDSKVVATVAASLSQNHQGESIPSDCTSGNSSFHSQVLLATALVKVQSRNSSSVALRSLIDQGSQASFITESAVQLLGLKKVSETSTISGLGGDPTSNLRSKYIVMIKIQSRLDPTFTITVRCHVLSKLTTFLPTKRVNVNINFPTLPPMVLADPSFAVPSKIDLLLGAEVYSRILLNGLVKDLPGSLVAQHTTLGWILSGCIQGDNHTNGESCQNVVVSAHLAHQDENELLKKFWELESEPSSLHTKHLTDEEKRCEDLFVQTTQRDSSGRYTVKLPFKTDDPQCKYGGSREIARRRFLILERRLAKDLELKAEYTAVIKDYISSGHMDSVISSELNNPNAAYLPHHAVVRQDKTTSKVRVVYDASCKGTNGASLNSDLMVGPTLQPELRHLVMRWRCYPIALVADIVKMYRQVQVAAEDQDFQRILWRENPEEDLQHLRLNRVTFGTSSAPFLAVRCLQQAAADEGKEFPLASARVMRDFYMDDLMTGCHSVAEGQLIHDQMTAMLDRAGFPLQKWSSNCSELLLAIQDRQSNNSYELELKIDEVRKILGLSWCRESDEFRFTVNLPCLDPPITKRKVISDIARLFDPLGWLGPAVTTAKIFIQRLWLSGMDWDSELPSSLLQEWLDFRNDLQALTKVRLPRWIESHQDNIRFELHGFSDASNLAYAAVVYTRIIDKEGNVHVHLVTSKTRVAPIKQVSIPRLELCGAVLLAKLLCEVAEILQIPKNHLHAWTDSTIVLAWLSSHPSRWKTFIANRVSEILTTLDGNQWSHVASKENPADCASRGLMPSDCVQNQLWYKGPSWLSSENVNYSKGNFKDTNLEERKPEVKCHAASCEKTDDEIISRFSSLRKLTRVIAFCRRVRHWNNPEKKKENKFSNLTAKEINESLLTCIKLCQAKYFSEEIHDLKTTSKVSKKSLLTSLNPFLDSDNVLRVGGRLHNAHLDTEMKHPIIIPHKSHFTNLLVDDAHSKTMHGGPQLMLNYLRCKYWVIGAKSLVRHFVRKCVTCVRHSSQTRQQMMGQLPSSRVTAGRPFHKSGVDYAGPINLRCSKGRGQRSEKGYICLFICMATRAIHLEVVSDMTAQGFLAAFKRFVARRGHVAELWSDNGTTFVGAARELKLVFDAERSGIATEIADWLASNNTCWRFIPPHSPNFGGLWEAGIKSTKHHLKRVLNNTTLTYEEMATTLSQIEACLNSRPLGQVSTNPDDPYPLTPSHFLVGEPLVIPPDFNFETENISLLKRWQFTQRIMQDFWRRWSQEYLTQLQHRYKWRDTCDDPKIGDVVLIKDDDLPPSRWLLGRITDKHPGLDGHTRVVTLKYKNNIIKRPLSKLVFLPVIQ